MISRERRLKIERGEEHLTPEEAEQGFHACYEWDGMLIGPKDPEYGLGSCCKQSQPKGEPMETLIYKDNNHIMSKILDSDTDTSGHEYDITNPLGEAICELSFQKGAVSQNGINGITTENVLAILIDRTRKLNDRFHCTENDLAIEHLELALESLEQRTKDRISRNVEGQEKN